MPVAPSFQNMEILCEPFAEKDKQYVRVRNQKTGNERKVRWYSIQEYNKLYPNNKIEDPHKKSQKEVLGFTDNEDITIYVGVTPDNEKFFRQSVARYARDWGWYTISSISCLEDLPNGVTPLKLPWYVIGDENGTLKPDEIISKNLKNFIKNNIVFQ